MTGSRGAGRRFPLQLGVEFFFVDLKQHQVSPSAIEGIGNMQDLLFSGAVNEAFALQTGRNVLTLFLGSEPFGF